MEEWPGELSQKINQIEWVLLFHCIPVYKYVDRGGEEEEKWLS